MIMEIILVVLIFMAFYNFLLKLTILNSFINVFAVCVLNQQF
jgi:hypothetical protein